MQYPKNFVDAGDGIRATRLRYRLLADGTIIDQHTGKTAGYISSPSALDELWNMRATSRQRAIREYLDVVDKM